MNLCLNLLPTGKKNRLEYLTNFLWMKDILELIILTLAVLGIILIWSWMTLEQQFGDLVASAVTLDRASFSYNKDVGEINKLVKDINAAGKNYSEVVPKLLEIVATSPNDIKINSLQIDKRSQILTIQGSAQTRNGLLKYQDLLKSLSWIEAVETPASQLFQKENINFEFKTKLKGIPSLQDRPVKKANQPNPDEL